MYDVETIRQDFPILSRKVHGKPLVYLDNGASAQKPHHHRFSLVVGIVSYGNVVCTDPVSNLGKEGIP